MGNFFGSEANAALWHHRFLTFSRFALFVVFFWFGALKIFDSSPASGLVGALLEKTLISVNFENFIVYLGIYEMILGVMFIIPGKELVAVGMLFLHMITAFAPLVMLPSLTWETWLVPTFMGQYIIKNLALIALALVLATQMHSTKHRLR